MSLTRYKFFGLRLLLGCGHLPHGEVVEPDHQVGGEELPELGEDGVPHQGAVVTLLLLLSQVTIWRLKKGKIFS